jgi:transcriptional regulator with XRE-family HTH domain
MTTTAGQVFARRLRELIPEGEVKEFAREIGMDLPALSKYRSGKTANPTLRTVERLAKALEVPTGYLMSEGTDLALKSPGIAETGSHYGTISNFPTETVIIGGASFVRMPKPRDPIAAGKPILTDGAIDEVHFVRLDWIGRQIRGRVPFGRVVLLDVATSWLGESMAPTIKPGAIIFADRGQECDGPTSFEPGSVYLVRHEGGVTCKRVWKTDGTLSCHSDNLAHPPFTIPLQRSDLDEIRDHLAAKIFWVGNPLP